MSQASQVPLIPHEELVRRIDEADLTLVDVLPADSYRRAHLPGALSLPAAEIERRAEALLPDRDADIVLYCASPG